MRLLLLTPNSSLYLGQGNADLPLILAASVLILSFALFVGFEKNDLLDPFVGVDLGRQGRGIGKLERHIACLLYTSRCV